MSLLHSDFAHTGAHARERPAPGERLRRTVEPQTNIKTAAGTDELAAFLGDPCAPNPGTIDEQQWRLYLRTATDSVVRYTDRELLPRQIVTHFDVGQGEFARAGGSLVDLFRATPAWLTLPRVSATGPAIVEIVATDGTVTALDADAFEFDRISEPHRLRLDRSPQGLDLALFNALRVSYEAGTADDEVAGPLELAVLQLAAYYYERRGAVGRNPMTESGVRSIVAPYRVKTGL
jgi:hypothetical protein